MSDNLTLRVPVDSDSEFVLLSRAKFASSLALCVNSTAATELNLMLELCDD